MWWDCNLHSSGKKGWGKDWKKGKKIIPPFFFLHNPLELAPLSRDTI